MLATVARCNEADFLYIYSSCTVNILRFPWRFRNVGDKQIYFTQRHAIRVFNSERIEMNVSFLQRLYFSENVRCFFFFYLSISFDSFTNIFAWIERSADDFDVPLQIAPT